MLFLPSLLTFFFVTTLLPVCVRNLSSDDPTPPNTPDNSVSRRRGPSGTLPMGSLRRPPWPHTHDRTYSSFDTPYTQNTHQGQGVFHQQQLSHNTRMWRRSEWCEAICGAVRCRLVREPSATGGGVCVGDWWWRQNRTLFGGEGPARVCRK